MTVEFGGRVTESKAWIDHCSQRPHSLRHLLRNWHGIMTSYCSLPVSREYSSCMRYWFRAVTLRLLLWVFVLQRLESRCLRFFLLYAQNVLLYCLLLRGVVVRQVFSMYAENTCSVVWCLERQLFFPVYREYVFCYVMFRAFRRLD